MEDNYQEFLLRIHQKVQERVKQNNHGRNYIRLFRPYNPHQVNIIGTFEDAIMAENGNAPMFDTNSRKAFGMVSSEQFFTYEQLALQPNSPFSDLRYFQEYIDKHYRNFCIDSEECIRAPEASAKTWQKAFLRDVSWRLHRHFALPYTLFNKRILSRYSLSCDKMEPAVWLWIKMTINYCYYMEDP